MSILQERQKTHGEYEILSAVAQSMKNILRAAPKYDSLSAVQRESVELICTKLARIVCGNPNERDHWVDICGYSDLVLFNDKNTASRASTTIMEMDPDEPSIGDSWDYRPRAGIAR